MRIPLALAVFVMLTSCESPSTVQRLNPPAFGSQNYSAWMEIPSPFEGERCFAYQGSSTMNGLVCKKIGEFSFKSDASPDILRVEGGH